MHRRSLLLLATKKDEEELAFELIIDPSGFQYPHGKTVTHVGPYRKTVIGTGPNSTSISVPE